MSTITATKYVSIASITELLDAIKTYGKDRVSTENMYSLLCHSNSNNIDTSEWYELIEIANDEMVSSTITELFSNNNIRERFTSAFGITDADLVSRLINVALERNLRLGRLPECTSIEQLNALAERDLAPLYFVEVVQSIDVDFVRKYADKLDLGGLRHHTQKEDVRELAQELYSTR